MGVDTKPAKKPLVLDADGYESCVPEEVEVCYSDNGVAFKSG